MKKEKYKKEVRRMFRKWIAILAAMTLLISLAGCRKDMPETLQTIPTEVTASTAPTEPSDAPEETKEPAKPETLPPETAPETLPPQTEPPATEPPETRPLETDPPATQPPATQPPATQPPATQPPATQPPATQPPATQPPATQTPATEPPATTTPKEDLYDISGDTITELEREMMDLINEERINAGLEPLEIDTKLCAITSARAYECSILFDHTRPNGEICFTALEDYGYTGYWTCGENILYCTAGFYDAAGMVQAWMNSEGHRKNILQKNFTKIGLAVYEADGYYYAANFFVGD